MYITVTGGTKRTQNLIKDSVEFFCLSLMHKNMVNNLYVDIEIIKNLTDKENVMGDIFNEGELSAPRDFVMRVCSTLEEDVLLKTIAHECVHIKQYAKGELKEISLNNFLWHKNKYDTSEANYWDLPWEIEAHNKEDELTRIYMENFK